MISHLNITIDCCNNFCYMVIIWNRFVWILWMKTLLLYWLLFASIASLEHWELKNLTIQDSVFSCLSLPNTLSQFAFVVIIPCFHEQCKYGKDLQKFSGQPIDEIVSDFCFHTILGSISFDCTFLSETPSFEHWLVACQKSDNYSW